MEKYRPNFEEASGYLGQYSENASTEQITGIDTDIGFPITGEVTYPPPLWFEAEGAESEFSGHYEENGFSVDFALQKPSSSKRFTERIKSPFVSHDTKKEMYLRSKLFVLDQLTLGIENDSKLDLLSDLPQDYIVFFIDTTKHGSSGIASAQDKFIQINGDLTKISTQLALLHEIGHRGHTFNDRIMKKQYLDENLSKEEMAVVLREERDAWAYALHKLKPFLKDKTIRDQALEMVHSCLSTHYQSIVTHEKQRNDLIQTLMSQFRSLFGE